METSTSLLAGSSVENHEKIYAIIDIGSSSLRMAIEQIQPDNSIKVIEFLEQEISIGKDTFANGRIEYSTTENCITALRGFKKILEELHISMTTQVKVVATSAVREAENRETFLDRVYSATGFNVEIVEDADVNRFTYLSIVPFLNSDSQLSNGQVLVFKISGGSTDLLYYEKKKLIFAQPYRLGSFRMRENLEKHGANDTHLLLAMENEIQKTVNLIVSKFNRKKALKIILLGGEIRIVASELIDGWDGKSMVKLSTSSLLQFTKKITPLSPDTLVHDFQIPFPEAESLVPALLTHCKLLSVLEIKTFYACPATMQDGIVRELGLGNLLSHHFQQDVFYSALQFARKYEVDTGHSLYVADMCKKMFFFLCDLFQLDKRSLFILQVAAILHEIGLFISNRNHHKHSQYLIQNSDIFGLGQNDKLIASIVARYHRKALPDINHSFFNALSREERITVSKLSAILRVADALDRSNTQRIKDFDFSIEDNAFVITVYNIPDLTLEFIGLKQKDDLFSHVFGMSVVLRKGRKTEE